MNNQSCKSFECDRISSLTVSKNSAYTLMCGSINIFLNKSRTHYKLKKELIIFKYIFLLVFTCSCCDVSIFPSLKYWVRLMSPSFRSDQCVDAHSCIIVSMSSIIVRELSKRVRDPFHEYDCNQNKDFVTSTAMIEAQNQVTRKA